MNDIIVNLDKPQAMIMSCDKKGKKHDLNINNSIISSFDFVTFLGIEIKGGGGVILALLLVFP